MLVVTVLVGLAVTAAVLMAITPLLAGLVQRQRAQAAADAAALAGAVGGRPAAADLAHANGAVLVAWSEDGDEVTVTVEVAGQRARARATDAP